MKSVCPPLAAALLAVLAFDAPAQLQPVVADQGRIALHFLEGILEQEGLELIGLQPTAEAGDAFEENMEGELLAFRLADGADLMVLQDAAGVFVPYGVLGGQVSVEGGFTLSSPGTGRAVDFHGFVLQSAEVRSDGPGGDPDPDYFYVSTAADPDAGDFVLCYVKVLFAPDEGYQAPGPGDHLEPDQLRIKAWDLIVTPTLAQKLGRPDLAGRVLAYGKLDATFAPHEGDWELPAGQNINTPYEGGSGGDSAALGSVLDVKLGILNSITQLGHTGSFPNGRAGLSMATTSCNVGDVNVTWLAAMNENHPGIAMQLYRDMGGRFEQVGVSWIKHGFFALSNSQCTACQNPSPGTFLGVGCSDTYGTSNNGDRFWLGPRDEWNPHAGTWECTGSYFDGTPVNCIRDENGSGNGPVDHRLEAFDYDLDNDGATYYYEAYYMVNGDQDDDNNIGSRRCTMSWGGSSWSFSTPSSGNSLVEGPAIERWPDADQVTRGDFGSADGTVIVAVNTTALGGGQWRYEYAVFNWSVDRRFRQFSVPNAGGASNITFHDIDDNASNNWVASTAGKNVTWTFPDVNLSGHKVAGPMEFCTLYNFGFTSNNPPATRNSALRVHDAGPGGKLIAVETQAPAVVALSASDLSPSEGQTIDLEVRGGVFGAMIGVIAVNGISITPLILTAVPVPFLGGAANVPLFIPAGLSGLEFDLVAADYDTSVVQLSNISTLAVE